MVGQQQVIDALVRPAADQVLGVRQRGERKMLLGDFALLELGNDLVRHSLVEVRRIHGVA